MMTNHDGVYIIPNYIPESTCKMISETLTPLLTTSDRDTHVKAALGLPNPETAAKINIDNPIIPIAEHSEFNEISVVITKLMQHIQVMLENTYKENLQLIQLTFNQLNAGGSNPVHVDDSTGMYSRLKYAALLYINQHGQDYKGGEIIFPNQSLEIQPKSGTLIFFKGDDERPHGVKTVSEGKRENLIMFFTTKE